MREGVQERRTSPKHLILRLAIPFLIYSKSVNTNLCFNAMFFRISCYIKLYQRLYQYIKELNDFSISCCVDAALHQNLLRVGVVIELRSLNTIHALFSVL